MQNMTCVITYGSIAFIILILLNVASGECEKCLDAVGYGLTNPHVTVDLGNLDHRVCQLLCLSIQGYTWSEYLVENNNCKCFFKNGKTHGGKLEGKDVLKAAFTLSQDCNVLCQNLDIEDITHGAYTCLEDVAYCTCYTKNSETVSGKVQTLIKRKESIEKGEVTKEQWKCFSTVKKEALREKACRLRTCEETSVGYYYDGHCTCYAMDIGKTEFKIHYFPQSGELHKRENPDFGAAVPVIVPAPGVLEDLMKDDFNCGLFCSGVRDRRAGTFNEKFDGCDCRMGPHNKKSMESRSWDIVATTDFSRTQDCTIVCQTDGSTAFTFGGYYGEKSLCVCFSVDDKPVTARLVPPSLKGDQRSFLQTEKECLFEICSSDQIVVYFEECECYAHSASRVAKPYESHNSQLHYDIDGGIESRVRTLKKNNKNCRLFCLSISRFKKGNLNTNFCFCEGGPKVFEYFGWSFVKTRLDFSRSQECTITCQTDVPGGGYDFGAFNEMTFKCVCLRHTDKPTRTMRNSVGYFKWPQIEREERCLRTSCAGHLGYFYQLDFAFEVCECYKRTHDTKLTAYRSSVGDLQYEIVKHTVEVESKNPSQGKERPKWHIRSIIEHCMNGGNRRPGTN